MKFKIVKYIFLMKLFIKINAELRIKKILQLQVSKNII